jgi:hypothetical protein
MVDYMDRHLQARDVFDLITLSQKSVSLLLKTENATTYRISYNKDYDIQLIHRKFYPTVDDVLEDFDISVCKIAWDGNKIWTGKNFARDVNDNRLRFDSVSRNSTKRLVKYWAYGYRPADEDFEKLLSTEDLSWEFSNDEYGA